MSRVRRVLSALGKPSAPGGAAARPEGSRGTSPAAPAPDGADPADTARALRALTRQVAELRGLLHQQAAFTMEALQRAGYQTEEEAAQQAALQRALRAARGGEVVAGPWTGEVGFELLYWIPFLAWLAEQGLDGRRLTVVSRGGAASWYAHLTSRYVDILDLVSAEEFRRRTEGPKKQVERRSEFDGELLGRAKTAAGVPEEAAVIHPSAMYRLFAALWRKRATVELVESFTAHRRLAAPGPFTADERPAGLPDDYVVAKFYFSKAFPDNTANRRFVSGIVQRVSAQAPLVLLSTSVRLDEHSDFQSAGGSGVYVLDAHRVPQRNLDLQTRVLAASRGFVGTYGGFSYLAPFFGVRSLSFFSRRFGFENHHLDLANRVFDRLLPGGFLALDRRSADLVTPAVAAWMNETPAAAADDDEPAASREPADVLT